MDTSTKSVYLFMRGFVRTAAVFAICFFLYGGSLGLSETAPYLSTRASRPVAVSLRFASSQILANDTILTLIPRCDNLKPLREAVVFPWTNFSKRVKELSKAEWGYFVCPQPAPIVSSFYHDRMRKPPYAQGETNWIVRREGTLGVYYSYATSSWLYLWVVPKPGDDKMSYVVAAKSTGTLINCRLRAPLVAPGNGWRAD